MDINGRVGSLLEVGTGFHPELTGRENVYLNGAILGMRRAEIARKFDEIVAFAEVEKFIDTPVKHYSSGMYMRLAFAVAAHLEPEILIVDEVLAVGDAEFQKKCLGKMGDVAKGGRTVLFVSHNMQTMARQSCDELCVCLRKALSITLARPLPESPSIIPTLTGTAEDGDDPAGGPEPATSAFCRFTLTVASTDLTNRSGSASVSAGTKHLQPSGFSCRLTSWTKPARSFVSATPASLRSRSCYPGLQPR